MAPIAGDGASDGRVVVFAVASGVRRSDIGTEPSAGGLERLIATVASAVDGWTSIIPMCAEGGDEIARGARWRIVAPRVGAAEAEVSAIHFARVVGRATVDALLAVLRNDRRVAFALCSASEPASPPVSFVEAPADDRWAIERVRFPQVWAALDVVADPRPIGILDAGNPFTDHPELAGRLLPTITTDDGGHENPHASMVAAIIGANRDMAHADRLWGSCSAPMRIYNVYRRNGAFDPVATSLALVHAAQHAAVLNISMDFGTDEPQYAAGIRYCAAKLVPIVVAVGSRIGQESGDLVPAVYPETIVVGGTGFNDGPVTTNRESERLWISAPGFRVPTIDRTGYGPQTGTSFATAFVSAAVWMIRMRRPTASIDEIKAILADSTRLTHDAPRPERSRTLGWGLLDMTRVARELGVALP